MGRIGEVRLRDRLGRSWRFYLWRNMAGPEYSLHLDCRDGNEDIRLPISEAQMVKMAQDVLRAVDRGAKLGEFKPTESEVVEAFGRLFTSSGKLHTLRRILDEDETVKGWLKNVLNGKEPMEYKK